MWNQEENRSLKEAQTIPIRNLFQWLEDGSSKTIEENWKALLKVSSMRLEALELTFLSYWLSFER